MNREEGMKTIRKTTRELSPDETVLANRAEQLQATRDGFPIADPFLAGVSELLHRICGAQSVEVARWQAGDALTLLRKHVTSKSESH